MPTTVLEYALICRMSSYREEKYLEDLKGEAKSNHEDCEAILFQQGWKPLDTSEKLKIKNHGYFGVAYYKIDPISKEVEIVIAHRGTCFGLDADGLGNVLADIEIAERREPGILREAAFLYTTKLLKHNFYSADKAEATISVDGYRVTKITHTGFSLGGFIAGASAAFSSFTNTYAITFDAPGIGNIPGVPKNKADHILNYVTRFNLVNTCNPHLGEVWEITAFSKSSLEEKDKLSVQFKLNFNDLGMMSESESYYGTSAELSRALAATKAREVKADSTLIAIQQLADTKDSHNLDKIIECIVEGSFFKQRISWIDASNKFIWGPRPFSSLSSLPSNKHWLILLVNVITIGAHIAQGVGVNVLWNATKKVANGQEIGIIGIEHSRMSSNLHEFAEQITIGLTDLFNKEKYQPIVKAGNSAPIWPALVAQEEKRAQVQAKQRQKTAAPATARARAATALQSQPAGRDDGALAYIPEFKSTSATRTASVTQAQQLMRHSAVFGQVPLQQPTVPITPASGSYQYSEFDLDTTAKLKF